MSLSKQWTRVVGIVLAVLVVVIVLHNFDVINTYPQLPHALSSLHTGPTPEAELKTESTPKAEDRWSSSRKTIVVGKLSEQDTQWIVDMKEYGWDNAIYVVDLNRSASSPTGLRTKMNKAKEAFPYLTYIVEHYDTFPDFAVFLHAHQNGYPEAWHNDAPEYDAVNMLNELRLDTVSDRGFVNLRCLRDPGCPAEISLNRSPPDTTKKAEMAYPAVFGDFFNMTVEDVKRQVPIVATPCCAQFAVTRAQVLERPRSEYERFLKLIEESDIDDDTMGTVMEYMWHIMFGRDPVMCEATKVCWAAVYGRRDDYKGPG